MNYQNIIVQKERGVARITLNRPNVLNALNAEILLELKAALDDIGKDDGVDVVILTGAGRAFCAGMDLKASSEHDRGGAGRPDQILIVRYVFEGISNLDRPVIAAVNGFALTGGLELALCCDMIIASENAVFGDTHCRVGTIPGGGDGTRLPRLVGVLKAKELIMTCDMLSAKEAERIGLVNKVVPADRLDEAAQEIAQKIRSNNQTAVRAAKALVDRGMNTGLDMALIMEEAMFKRFNERRRGRMAEDQRRAAFEKTRASLPTKKQE